MKISVVTTVLNNEWGIIKLLTSLLEQEGPFEVVICDAGSSDSTMDIVRMWQKVGALDIKFTEVPGPRGKGFATAAAAASGDILCFIGSDDVADKDWLHEVHKAFEDPGTNIVTGKSVPVGFGPKMDRVPWIVAGQDITWPGCNTAYRTQVYHDLGGIDPAFITAEDMELNLRAVMSGYRIRHVPDAVVFRGVRSWRSYFSQAYWNGVGRGQIRRKHGKVPGMAGGALGALRKPYNVPRLLVGGLGYIDGRRRRE